MWGLIPAAGAGSRIQPLAFSKELLPVGSRIEDGIERPCAVCEYLLDRMIFAGADKICFIIGPGKSDIIHYFGGSYGATPITYVVQQKPAGLCHALFCSAPFIDPRETVLIGLPDTVWMPRGGYSELAGDQPSLLLFPVEQPALFDSVIHDAHGRVQRIDVKVAEPETHWIWGGIKLKGSDLHDLKGLWQTRLEQDEYLGTLLNAWMATGRVIKAVPAGTHYVDVGTFEGYRSAITLLCGVDGLAAQFAMVPPPASHLQTFRTVTPSEEII